MEWLALKLGTTGARIAAALGLALLVLGLLGTAKCALDRAGQAETEAKLNKNQAGAAVESGKDAVETVGSRNTEDAAGNKTAEETKDAIAKSTDAAGVTGAGRDGLCGLAGYRQRPECLRGPDPH